MQDHLKVLLFIASIVLISACDTQNSELTPNQEIEANSTSEPKTTTELTDENISPTEAALKGADQQEAAEANNADNVTDNAQIVSDFDFSTAVVDEQSVQTEENPLFCLGVHNKASEAHEALEKGAVETIVNESCKALSNRLASLTFESCLNAKLIPTQCNSVKGFPILYREFAPLPSRQPRGRVLIIGGTHGDELTSVSMAFRWIEKLNKYHSGLFHWHVIPAMNPDGILKKSATRTNQNGVDLNRNLPSTDWSLNALKYWHEKTNDDPRKYPGEQAASEPENQWLIDEINTFKPDAIISIHAPYGIVDFDSPALITAPKSLGKLRLNLLGTYPGSLGNYAGISRDIPTITLELPHSWIMPSQEESTKIWNDVVDWLKANINSPSN